MFGSYNYVFLKPKKEGHILLEDMLLRLLPPTAVWDCSHSNWKPLL